MSANLAVAVGFPVVDGKGAWDDTTVVLAYDSPQPAEERRCDHCGRSYLLVRAFITRDGDAYAIVFAACHVHEGEREAWIDAILGTFSSDDHSNHVTFGARVGPVAGQAEPAATAVPAAAGTLRDLRVAEVVKQDIHLDEGGAIIYRTKLQLSFKYESGH